VDEFDGLLESILRDALQLVEAPDGYIMLYDKEKKTFFVHHGIGLYESWIMESQPAEFGMQGYVYKTGEILAVDDYRQYPERRNDKRLDRLTSAIILPLKREGQVQGMLCACWSDVVHHISIEDVQALRQFCDLVAVALKRTNTQKKIRQLMNAGFVDTVRRSIGDAGILQEQLEIEITESVLIESMEDSICKLVQLRDGGLMISLDDFGTGYSSLTYLRSLPVGVLKIDKSFIDNIASDEIQFQMVGSIIDLAHALGLTTIAEGVETEDQLKQLTQCGCDCIQGYIFSPPIPEEEAIEFLK